MRKVFLLFLCLGCVVAALSPPLPQLVEDSGIVECDQNFLKTPLKGVFPSGNNLSLLSWNVYKEQGQDWEKDFTRFSAGVDILALQESVLINGHNAIYDELGYSYDQTTGFLVNEKSFGVVVGVGDELSGQETQSCGLRIPEPMIRLPKTTMLTRIGTDKGELMVVSIHSVNFSLGIHAYKAQLRSIAKILKGYQKPIIIAGDFNTWSQERQQLVDEFAAQLDLQPVPYLEDNRSLVFSHALDHVYVRGVENIRTQVFRVNSSDHSPIRVDFSLM